MVVECGALFTIADVKEDGCACDAERSSHTTLIDSREKERNVSIKERNIKG